MEVENLQLDVDAGWFFAIWGGYAELPLQSMELLKRFNFCSYPCKLQSLDQQVLAN